jgi:glycosyltransferase involved in cell wall biosynthesis
MTDKVVNMVDSVVAVSSYGASAASTRVRMYDWFAHAGITAQKYEYIGTSDNQVSTLLPALGRVVGAELELRRLADQVRDATLMLSRRASPFSSGAIESTLLRRSGRSVYDFDDALFNDISGWRTMLWSKQKAWVNSVRAANVVLAGSEMLAEEAAKFSSNVVMIPSCVEPEDYRRKVGYDIADVPRAIWVGSPATERFLAEIGEQLLALNKRYGLRITVISSGNASLGELDTAVDRHPWTFAGVGEHLAGADFGLMPLPDTPYTRGKCSYKLLQYAAAGLPVIGSPVGANIRVLDSLGGLAPKSTHDWYAAIESMVEMTSQNRFALGRLALAQVTKQFSFAAWESTWLDAMGQPDRANRKKKA